MPSDQILAVALLLVGAVLAVVVLAQSKAQSLLAWAVLAVALAGLLVAV